MNKNELIAQVAETAELSKVDAARAVDAVFDSIAAVLKNGDE
ncbi:MAG: HU family DNA-binding protein, partial [Ferrovibrionaceae bacterium]